ncbi:MAG: PTS sugar transporter subunit IIA [Planctomycetota bacterium]
MPLVNHLVPDCVRFLSASNKAEAIKELLDCLAGRYALPNRDEIAAALRHREDLMSTGIGLGIAVPHVRLAAVPLPMVAVGIHHAGIVDYESLDGKPVHVIVMILAGKGQHEQYIQLLADVTRTLRNEKTRHKILASVDAAEVHALLLA